MTEIDTNPTSKASIEFNQKLEALEGKKTERRTGEITIKTIRRGAVRKMTKERYETDQSGRVSMMDKRIVRYQEYGYPSALIDDFYVKEGNLKIKLQTYQFPVLDGVERKGAVFFIHGIHDYAGRYAYLAQRFASQGYDFYAMD